MRGLAVSRSATIQVIACLTSAAVSLRAENPDAALALHDAALVVAPGKRPSPTVTRHPVRSVLRPSLAMGRAIEAEADLAEAKRRAGPPCTDARLRDNFELLILSPERRAAADAKSARPWRPRRARSSIIAGAQHGRAIGCGCRAFQLQLAKANIVWGNRSRAGEARARATALSAFEAERARSPTRAGSRRCDQIMAVVRNGGATGDRGKGLSARVRDGRAGARAHAG